MKYVLKIPNTAFNQNINTMELFKRIPFEYWKIKYLVICFQKYCCVTIIIYTTTPLNIELK